MTCDPGVELAVEADSSGDVDTADPFGDKAGDDGLWNIAFTAREAPELVPYYPSAKHPALYGAAAEYVERKVAGTIRIPESGVLCSGILSTTGPTEEEGASGGLTDVYFAVQSPRPGKEGGKARQILLQVAVLSVSAAEGAALARTKSGAGPLLRRLQAGEITCAAHTGLMIRSGLRSKGGCLRWVKQPGEGVPAQALPEVLMPQGWGQAGCGVELDVEYTATEKGISVSGSLQWDASPVLDFGEPGAEVPEMEKRRCEERVRFDDLLLKAGEPVIVDAQASQAREGAPEHGRWHVTVLVAR